tara:strand:+ start:6823 stop:8004 length:1182 start_codon:yes stop_codon:yes gene_type:complete
MIKLFIKYFIYDGKEKKIKSSFLLPFITIIIGSYVMFLSFAIMDGFAREISKVTSIIERENSIKVNKKEFSLNGEKKYDDLISFLHSNNYIYNILEERYLFIENNFTSGVAKVFGISNLNKSNIKPYFLYDFLDTSHKDSFCYFGIDKSFDLNINVNDSLNLISVLDFNNFYSYPNKNLKVTNILKTNLSRYDNSIFINYDSILFKNNIYSTINLNSSLSKNDYNYIIKNYNYGIKILENNHAFDDLFFAINFEKLFYGLFGLIIVSISSIMMVGFNISSIISNVHSIGLLQSIGFSKKDVKLAYLFNSIITTILAILISLIAYEFTLYMDENYELLSIIFDPNIYFSFDLKLFPWVKISIILIIVTIILISTIYPLQKINKLNIIDSIRKRV